ncbi:MAG: hypothetical protein RH860_04465 [Cytophagales bacterium]
MKYAAFLLTSILFCSCNSDESAKIDAFQSGVQGGDNLLVGQWKLIEMLSDPGDGSGTFSPVQSDKMINFYADLTFESTEKLCYMVTSSHDKGKGTYSIESNFIYPDSCTYPTELSFQLNKDTLIITYLCIEPCAEKYLKVSNN